MSEEYTPFKMRSGNTTAFKSMGSSPAKQTIKEIFNKGVKGVKNVGDKIINTDIKDIPTPIMGQSFNDIKNLLTPKKEAKKSVGTHMAQSVKELYSDSKKVKKKEVKKVEKKKEKKKIKPIQLDVKTPELTEGLMPKKHTKKKYDESGKPIPKGA